MAAHTYMEWHVISLVATQGHAGGFDGKGRASAHLSIALSWHKTEDRWNTVLIV